MFKTRIARLLTAAAAGGMLAIVPAVAGAGSAGAATAPAVQHDSAPAMQNQSAPDGMGSDVTLDGMGSDVTPDGMGSDVTPA